MYTKNNARILNFCQTKKAMKWTQPTPSSPPPGSNWIVKKRTSLGQTSEFWRLNWMWSAQYFRIITFERRHVCNVKRMCVKVNASCMISSYGHVLYLCFTLNILISLFENHSIFMFLWNFLDSFRGAKTWNWKFTVKVLSWCNTLWHTKESGTRSEKEKLCAFFRKK